MDLLPEHSIEARKLLGLSQAAVAKDAGVSRPLISQFENGRAIMVDAVKRRLAEYYIEQGYEFPDDDQPGDEDHESEAAEAESEKPRRRRLAPRIPGGTYLVDGHLVPKGVSPGRAELLLGEASDNHEEIAEFLLDDRPVHPIEVDGFFGSSFDHSPVNAQLDQAARVIVLMARNYLLLTRLRGEDAAADSVLISRGHCSDCDEPDPEYLRTNAGVVALALDAGFASLSGLSESARGELVSRLARRAAQVREEVGELRAA